MLIYLAKIDRKIPLKDYWFEYPEKRVRGCQDKSCEEYSGDNIYKVSDDGKLVLDNDNHHGNWAYKSDVEKGQNAIICSEFYYFAPDNRLSISITSKFVDLIKIGPGQKLNTNSDLIEEFIAFVRSKANGTGIIGTINRHPASVSGCDDNRNANPCSLSAIEQQGCSKSK